MTSNYQNSAGTDLDSLFTIDNGNAGAIGFQISSGQDLGNRYSSASHLNYNLGFQNSAGTDIGYLRGNVPSGNIYLEDSNNSDYWNSPSVKSKKITIPAGISVLYANFNFYSGTYEENIGAEGSSYGQWYGYLRVRSEYVTWKAYIAVTPGATYTVYYSGCSAGNLQYSASINSQATSASWR